MADCATFILWNGTQALMENRPDLGPGVDPYFIYPGGKVDVGEAHENAMLRECVEEAGVSPVTWTPLTSDELWSNPNHHSPKDDVRGWRVYPYVVTAWAGEVPTCSRDHQRAQYAWIDPAMIAGPDDGFTCRAAIARLLRDHHA